MDCFLKKNGQNQKKIKEIKGFCDVSKLAVFANLRCLSINVYRPDFLVIM